MKQSRSKLILGLLMSVLAMALMAPIYSSLFEVTVQDAFLGSFVVSLVITAFHVVGILVTGRLPFSSGVAMAITAEFWQNIIIDNLFKDNSFMAKCHRVGKEYILGGKVVHIPQAGAAPTIVKNRAVFPAAASERTDTEVNYNLDSYSSDPVRVRNLEEYEISYDKAVSVLEEMISALREDVADDLLYKWAFGLTASNIVRTSGALDAAFLPHSTATGTRRKFTKEDVKKVRFLMNKQKFAKEGRSLLLPSEFYDQLMDDNTLLTRDTAREVDVKNGVVIRLYGIDIMERSDVLMADNAGTPAIKAVGAADAATDNLTALAWGEKAVELALGDVDFFENVQDALHYGNVYSSEIRAGGRRRRTNAEGTISIIQAAS